MCCVCVSVCVIMLSENKPAAERNGWNDTIYYSKFFKKPKKKSGGYIYLYTFRWRPINFG